MTTEEFIIALFCEGADRLGAEPKQPQARLWPPEVVMIGLLFVLKGVQFRPFYRGLKWEFEDLFVELPERTRLTRPLQGQQAWTDKFLADATFFTLVDRYGIELTHPIRAGRSQA